MKPFHILLLSLLLCGAARAQAAPAPPGLYVRAGVVMRAGKPYRGIGANYFSLLARVLKNPDDDSSLKNLDALGKAGIPFVRFMAGGFWPSEMKLYQQDKEEYFRRFDKVVHAAETAHVGLIPSLFWNTSTVADLCGEPLDQYGNPDSKSIAFIRQYTTDVVTRYKESPAIWAWEFGNEYNLGADLPNAAQHRPQIVPQLGTPATRSERDELKWPQIETALRAFAETVRKLDADRLIESGHSIPRQSAWHNVRERSWTDDSVEQFGEILKRDNPAPLDAICIHVYPEAKKHYAAGATSIDGVIAAAQQQARLIGKPLFIGEFGVNEQAGDKAAQQAIFEEFLSAFKNNVPLAAFWVFDLPQQNKDWNVTFDNDRAWMIERVARFNRDVH
jgi:hypothetical protein